MPIYEFYCGECNTVYSFFSRTVNTEKIPGCPHCKDVRLNRKVSLFAAVSGGKGNSGADAGMPDLDGSKMEKAMAMLSDEAGKINENDPRQAAALMKKLSEATGINMGPGMEEALRRLERGEDPDKIEDELGDILEKEEPFVPGDKGKIAGGKSGPKIDETLYEL
ncbi:MAG: zinc ribbon domain-containing protein [Nitrospirae bacterium]|nr:zinc ribbon domain-containing protein [Nitrospirota bacterium]